MFLLDTDHLTIIQRQTQPDFDRLSERMSQHAPTDFYLSIVSFHEQTVGCHTYITRARDTAGLIRGYEALRQMLTDFTSFQLLPFDQAAGDQLDDLQTRRLRLAAMDLRIAAIALAQSMTLLTRNLGHFRRVPGLVVEDWTT
jgi:tRNA(fMet)-specific endonuclease VapC